MSEKYEDLEVELLLNNKDEIKVNEYKILFNEYYKSLESIYNKKYHELTDLKLTLDKEQIRLTQLINIIEKRIKEVSKLEKVYKRITKENINNEILGLKELEIYQNRLNSINIYLECLKEYKEIDNQNDKLKDELISKDEIDNSIYKQIKENEKKLDKLYKKIIVPEIIAILYEFCIIDTYDIDKLDRKNLFDERKEIIIREEKIIEKEIKVPIPELITEDEPKIESNIPNMSSLGSVKPVNKIEEINKIKEENPNLTLPDLGLTNSSNNIILDNEKYLK